MIGNRILSLLGYDDLMNIMWTVIRDHPYEFYWFGNATSCGRYDYGLCVYNDENGTYVAFPSSYSTSRKLFDCLYIVSAAYAVDDDDDVVQGGVTYHVRTDASKTSLATTAA